MRSHPPGPVLILAPLGRDAALAAQVLGKEGIVAQICANLPALVEAIGPETGAVLLADEAIKQSSPAALLEKLATQEPWSDLPILLLTHDIDSQRRVTDAFGKLSGIASFAMLERPFRTATLISMVDSALRARQRQRQVRDLLVQRNEALHALAESEERQRVANEASQVGTWDFTPDTGVLIWDDRCRAHFGIRPGTPMSYELFLTCLHPEDRARTDDAVRAALSPNGPGYYHIEYRTIGLHDGVERWVAATGRTSIHPQSKAQRFSGTAIDITQRKLAELDLARAKEELEAASAAKDHFLATLSHELRTPLTPVLMGLSEIDSELEVSREVREILDMIRRNIELEARLIDDLLDLTRIARGKLELRSEVADAHELLRAAIDVCGDSEVNRRRLCLLCDPQAAEHHVWGDPARLQQVFWNLLHNAIKFTGEGGRISARTFNPAPGRIAIEISDNGIGLAPEKISVIFGAFEQGDRAITRRFGGLGLGLAICKAIADLHQGSIRAASDGPGHGATFTVEFATVAPPASAASESSSDGHAPTLPGRVLLVEDHASTSDVLARLLRRAGHTVQIAHNLDEARKFLTEGKFDLLISDLGLPDGSGMELMSGVRSSGIRGIALSGYGMEQDVRACHDAGFDEHLTKPVDWARLRTVVQQLLQRAQR